MMKKYIWILVIVLIALSGCSAKQETENTTSKVNSESTQVARISTTSNDTTTEAMADTAVNTTKDATTNAFTSSNMDTKTTDNEKTAISEPVEHNNSNLSEEEFWSLFKIKKDEVLKKLGEKYEIVGAGVEGSEDGYFYADYGITIIFDDSDKVYSIYCTPKVSISGAHAEMNFEQVQKILGKSKIEETSVETPENKAYNIVYIINNCTVEFLSYYKDGKESMLTVYSPN